MDRRETNLTMTCQWFYFEVEVGVVFFAKIFCVAAASLSHRSLVHGSMYQDAFLGNVPVKACRKLSEDVDKGMMPWEWISSEGGSVEQHLPLIVLKSSRKTKFSNVAAAVDVPWTHSAEDFVSWEDEEVAVVAADWHS
mmetsp:Transcript_42318/g.88881  ORF Transcript_42318/g.88881 Transcript_42318/m.88881 type:complete len:138 (+) Transcript_42318:1198-1611(+)